MNFVDGIVISGYSHYSNIWRNKTKKKIKKKIKENKNKKIK